MFGFVQRCSGVVRRGWSRLEVWALVALSFFWRYRITIGEGCVLDWTGLALCLLAAFHPPPNPPPERGEG